MGKSCKCKVWKRETFYHQLFLDNQNTDIRLLDSLPKEILILYCNLTLTVLKPLTVLHLVTSKEIWPPPKSKELLYSVWGKIKRIGLGINMGHQQVKYAYAIEVFHLEITYSHFDLWLSPMAFILHQEEYISSNYCRTPTFHIRDSLRYSLEILC